MYKQYPNRASANADARFGHHQQTSTGLSSTTTIIHKRRHVATIANRCHHPHPSPTAVDNDGTPQHSKNDLARPRQRLQQARASNEWVPRRCRRRGNQTTKDEFVVLRRLHPCQPVSVLLVTLFTNTRTRCHVTASVTWQPNDERHRCRSSFSPNSVTTTATTRRENVYATPPPHDYDDTSLRRDNDGQRDCHDATTPGRRSTTRRTPPPTLSAPLPPSTFSDTKADATSLSATWQPDDERRPVVVRHRLSPGSAPSPP